MELQDKKPENVRVLILGAGAAAIAVAKLAMRMFGFRKRQLMMFDSKGVINTARAPSLPTYKLAFARDTKVSSLEGAMRLCDIVIGVARGDMIKPPMVRKMRKRPIILAMANPIPEIMPAAALEARNDVIIATGRSDFPNQVNNSVCFPYLFRAALDARAKKFSHQMFIAAARAIAELARRPAPPEVAAAAGPGEILEFGPEYILPKQFDPRLREKVTEAVMAAVENPDSVMPRTEEVYSMEEAAA